MKKFFNKKINGILLFLIIAAGTYGIVRHAPTLNLQKIQPEVEASTDGMVTHADIMQLVGELNGEADSLHMLPKLGLRSQENEHPMGWTDSTIIRCFTDMGPVEFSPKYKYREVGGATANNRLYGFSIPLVGDLNGDGKPEIVALGYNGTTVNSSSSYLYVFNGQTGEEIVKFHLPATTTVATAGAYHGSPSQLALVDADRNGKAEIIFAFNNASGDWRKKLVSWEVNERTFDDRYKPTDNSKLTHKWTSDFRYDHPSNAGARVYDYPMPQIVDIEGDGEPEVVVYNKIYSALTGKLKVTLESLGTTINNKTAYIGSSGNEIAYNEFYIAFPMLYDIDGDGKYDFIAGGKIYYDINTSDGTYKTLNYSSVNDGRTAVADVNGDGKPDIVVTNYSSKSLTGGTLVMTVWNPDFVNNTGEIIAQHSFTTYNLPAQGNHSYIFIGDIDGKVQNGQKLPEISILTSCPYLTSGYNMRNIPVHPNVTDGGITSNKTLTTNSQGVIISFTWDNTKGLSFTDRLKVSFMLEHRDRSVNTGFTLFDFDNDGVQDICYRDERTLRIISARKSYVKHDETEITSPDVIRFRQEVWSFTGYEYPVIADVDGDASADMIVMGRSSGGTDNATGYIFAIEGANRDLAPAPKVWNQFMYSPLKINEDLTTPMRTFDPLSDEFAFYKSKEDKSAGIKTYIYNNTVTQTTFYSENSEGIIHPIVRTPDAKLYDLSIDIDTKKLSFKLTNIGDATVHMDAPIVVYKEGVVYKTLSCGHGGVFVGETYDYSVDIDDPLATYTIVVGGTLDAQGTLIPAQGYEDCDWANNMDDVAIFLPKNDAVTVIQYGTALIDVLANDILLDACSDQQLTNDMITTPAGKGVMSGDFGSLQIAGNKLLYAAPASWDGGVVELSYTLTCEGKKKTAKVFIYIVESCSASFASCAGGTYNVCLKDNNPQGVKFDWYDMDDKYIRTASSFNISLPADVSFYVKPTLSAVVGSPYRTVDFPKAKLTIKVLNPSGQMTMQWTGAVDYDWNNPNNWVEMDNGEEKPVSWRPESCVDVIIPAGLERYPELSASAECGQIHLENRAMIAGIHHLYYTNASVDLQMAPTEKDRFVMWSAPLKDMYTGDYHFLRNGAPDWGHIYMNFFQSANPDNPQSVATEKTFTSTFGSIGTALPLGKAFNVKVLSGKEEGFTFPKTHTSYTDDKGNVVTVTRGSSSKFITDGVLTSSGELNLPVEGDNSFHLIQVVNPFMAYLDVNKLLSNGKNSQLAASYYIWNGDVQVDFMTILPYEDETGGMRYVIDNTQMAPEASKLVAPLQSFFLAKASKNTPLKTVYIDHTMVTTRAESPYVLKNAGGEDESGLLRVTLSQGDVANSTVLLRRPGAVQAFSPKEDALKAFNHGAPASVYTLTSANQPLAINACEIFDTDVPLGIRIENPSLPLTFSFSGLTSFGQSVFLVDHALSDKVVDLSQVESYQFVVAENAGAVELNNRFSIRFGDSPTGIEKINQSLSFSGKNSSIEITSSTPFQEVEVINMAGVRVYYSLSSTNHLRIPADFGQVYVVRVKQGNEIFTRKLGVTN